MEPRRRGRRRPPLPAAPRRSSDELRRSFHDDLADLQHRVAGLAGVVVGGIGTGTAAVLRGDLAAAEDVVVRNQRIAAAYPGIERDVCNLIARQAPVARDLRFLIATLRIAQEVERCGQLLVSIGRRGPGLDAGALTPRIRRIVEQMDERATLMFDRASRAYQNLDATAAGTVPAMDDAIDELHRRLLGELFDARHGLAASIVELGLIARLYERIADHAVVIAERVCFIAEGPTVAPPDRGRS